MAGNSFYGSRLGGSFCCSVEVWSRIPRVYWLVFPSTDRGQVVLRFVRELGSFQQGRLYLLSIFRKLRSTTATAATERLSEALRINNVEVLFVEDKVELGVTPVCS